MRFVRAFMPAVLMLCCLLHGAQALAANPALLRGIALHAPMTWGRTTAGHKEYLWPVYSGTHYDVPVRLLRKVKEAGFDFVRLSVDPGPFLAHKGTKREELYQRLKDVVGQIRQEELDVLIDFHPIGMVKAYAPERIESNEDGLFDAYVKMVGHTAGLFADQIDHVAIEPMNEPQLGYNPLQRMRLQGMMQHLYQAVRVAAPSITVVVSGGRGGSLEGLLDLDPSPFIGDVRYSFHYYLPYVFTMQGVKDDGKNSRIWRYAAGLPYPVRKEGFPAFWAQVQQRVNKAHLTPGEKSDILANGREQIEEYFDGKGTSAAVDMDFSRVSDWAASNGIPPEKILMGEFGASQHGPSNSGAEPLVRANWLRDVRGLAETRGFHWSLWNLNDDSSDGMTLVSVTNPAKLDALTLKALGMRVP